MKLNTTFFAALLLNASLTSFAALVPDLHGRNPPFKPTTTTLTTSQSASSATSSAPPAATSSAQSINAATLQDMQTIHERRLTSIIGALASPNSIPAWLSTLGADGKWPDSEVDYTTGCAARRANWPAQTHWQRILVMTGAWHGGIAGGDQYVKNDTLHAAISLAMDYWFGRDFTNLACMDLGGTSACPCDNADNSLWNTNWYSNIILIPGLAGQTCLMLNDTLTATQLSNCARMTGRSYGTFDHYINGIGYLTGANTLDVAKMGIDSSLLNLNVSMLTDAYRRVHSELSIKTQVKADGIRPDGSFGQHEGILYNGNYGKDYVNDILDLEVAAAGTQFAAGADSKTAFATLFSGNKWMIYRNTLTGVLHWDFSALGRFISFPVIDKQATGSIKINLTEVTQLGTGWSSSPLTSFASSLSKGSDSANAGNLLGNNMFYDNDYMVHRGRNYVSTLKMYSSRTQNTECTNLQNPFGFHLSDGVLYTYLRGNEYEDISAAWDWNLIPGITVDYGATPLNCDGTAASGVEAFVGGVSTGQVGVAAMRYTNPNTTALHWQKAWFFLQDDVQHVMVSGVASSSGAPVYSVLDQRLHNGSIMVDGSAQRQSNSTTALSLWHGDVGYSFPKPASLSVQFGNKTGNWSSIGTSTQPASAVDLFAAWIQHTSLNTSIEYTTFPGTTYSTFNSKRSQLRVQTIQNDQNISAIFDQKHNTAMAIFWNSVGGSVTFTPASNCAPLTIAANSNIALVYDLDGQKVTVSDPSQNLTSVQVTLTTGNQGKKPTGWGSSRSKTLKFQLPTNTTAGKSVALSV